MTYILTLHVKNSKTCFMWAEIDIHTKLMAIQNRLHETVHKYRRAQKLTKLRILLE